MPSCQTRLWERELPSQSTFVFLFCLLVLFFWDRISRLASVGLLPPHSKLGFAGVSLRVHLAFPSSFFAHKIARAVIFLFFFW